MTPAITLPSRKQASFPQPGAVTAPTPLKMAPQANARFGNAAIASDLSLAAKTFRFLENRPLVDLVAKDVACFNIPQLSLAAMRSKQELLDQIPNSLGLTAWTITSMLVIPKVLRQPMALLSGIKPATLARELTPEVLASLPQKEKLARLGVSFGFHVPFGAGFAAVPYARNYLTLKRLGTDNFDALIGYDKIEKKSDSDAEVKAKMAKQIKVIKGLILGSAALTGASLLGFGALARMAGNEVKQGGAAHWLFNRFALRGKSSSELSGDLATLIFWLLPPYIAWQTSARSNNERIENGVKAGNSILWFSMFTPAVVSGPFLKRFAKLGLIPHKKDALGRMQGSIPSYNRLVQLSAPLREQAIKLKTRYKLASWLIPVTMLGTTPQLLNIYFTNRREMAKGKHAALQGAAMGAIASTPRTAPMVPRQAFAAAVPGSPLPASNSTASSQPLSSPKPPAALPMPASTTAPLTSKPLDPIRQKPFAMPVQIPTLPLPISSNPDSRALTPEVFKASFSPITTVNHATSTLNPQPAASVYSN